MIVFNAEQYDLIRRFRNEGYGVDDTVVELRPQLPGVTRADVLAAIRVAPPIAAPNERVRNTHHSAVGEVMVPPERKSDAKARSLAPFRGMVGAMMGDPRVGFSALDRLLAQEGSTNGR